MKRPLTLLIALVLLLALGAWMTMFQVRYDENAVLATFEAASQENLIEEPGLYWKAPWPIQRVYKQPTTLQIFEDQLQELQTADKYAVVVKLMVTWRIEDPYAFYKAVNSSVARAEDQLKPLLRDLTAIPSEYRFDQLVNADASKVALPEIERRLTEAMRDRVATLRPSPGIAIEQVGIVRTLLPEATTQKVGERMIAVQEAAAQRVRSEGESAAASIRSTADSVRQRVLAFAERRAQAIRAEGDREAAEVLPVFNQAPDLAIFLRQLAANRKIWSGRDSTFVFDAKTIAPINVLNEQPPVGVVPTGDDAAATTDEAATTDAAKGGA